MARSRIGHSTGSEVTVSPSAAIQIAAQAGGASLIPREGDCEGM